MHIEVTCLESHVRDVFFPYSSILATELQNPAARREFMREVRSAPAYLRPLIRLAVRRDPSTDKALRTLFYEQYRECFSDVVAFLARFLLDRRRAADGGANVDGGVDAADSVVIRIFHPQYLPHTFEHLTALVRRGVQQAGCRLQLDLVPDSGASPGLTDFSTSQLGGYLRMGTAAGLEPAILGEFTARRLSDDCIPIVLGIMYGSEFMARAVDTAVHLLLPVVQENAPVLFSSYTIIGAHYSDTNQLDMANVFFRKAWDILAAAPDLQPTAFSTYFYYKLAVVLSMDRELFSEDAGTIFDRAIEQAEAVGLRWFLPAITRSVSYYYSSLSQGETALAYGLRALELAREQGYPLEVFLCLRNAGVVLQMQKRSDEALEYLDAAASHEVSGVLPVERARIHNSIGFLHFSHGRWQESLAQYTRAFRLLVDAFADENIAEITVTLNNMFEVLLATNNLSAALSYAEMSHQLAAHFTSRRLIRRWNLIQSIVFLTHVSIRLGDMQAARDYLQLFRQHRRVNEHFINVFHQRRLEVLIDRDFSPERISGVMDLVAEQLDDSAYLQIYVVYFYMDLYSATGEHRWHAAAGSLAEKYDIRCFLDAYETPPPLDIAKYREAVPFDLLFAYVGIKKDASDKSHQLLYYRVVHDFGKMIINENSLSVICDFLRTILLENFSARFIFLFVVEDFSYSPVIAEASLAPDTKQELLDGFLTLGTQLLGTHDRGIRIGRSHDYQPNFCDSQSVLLVPIGGDDDSRGFLVVGNSADDNWVYTEEDTHILQSIIDLLHLKMDNIEYVTHMENVNQIDSLTGLYNIRVFQQKSTELLALFARRNIPFCMLVLDADNFKQVNDQLGHLEGNRVIKKTARTLLDTVRAYDIVIRYGGDEFIVLIPDAELTQAVQAAERIRHAIAAAFAAEAVPLTVSVGAGQYANHYQDMEEFFQAVDRALYHAKRTKNCVQPV
ncbi:diguanylate cyclase [Spirochaeta africana]|uniref:diguanylate cyclase n=1 Tax=Spirochaeta africana (strain ATCC 700263 / DSM 8902 / Z-7692) TaxID=889378 RepID=H9UHF0_SPIAZ|nr:diguanylate cyclase [Spirochaeta africana]AFG36943.1 diguanylate cyclase (GGDEF) domain-containing protein [Spirochaeta africana DSM 8902]